MCACVVFVCTNQGWGSLYRLLLPFTILPADPVALRTEADEPNILRSLKIFFGVTGVTDDLPSNASGGSRGVLSVNRLRANR